LFSVGVIVEKLEILVSLFQYLSYQKAALELLALA
jgi:hypothetical protein